MNSEDEYINITDNQYLERLDRGLRVNTKRLDVLVSSSKKQIELLEETKNKFWELESKLDSIRKNTDDLERDFFDRTFTIIVPVLLGMIFLVLLIK